VVKWCARFEASGAGSKPKQPVRNRANVCKRKKPLRKDLYPCHRLSPRSISDETNCGDEEALILLETRRHNIRGGKYLHREEIPFPAMIIAQ
jgi:hypothetical protein